MIWFFVFVAALLAVLFGLYWWWSERIKAEIAEGVEIEWAHFQKNEPEFLDGLSEQQFREIYARVHTPRFPRYALGAFATFLVSLPVTLGLLSALMWGAEKIGMTPEPIEVADRLLLDDGKLRFFQDAPPEAALYYIEDLAGFYYFFGVIIVWLIIVAIFMRRYHSRRPGYLRDEILRAKE
ncbi:MAG: hypothetical protein GXP04_14750 [Alphaproteobacteria bacterium]|nr:hypothetical protein [Alphaproteobacteria bacterium]